MVATLFKSKEKIFYSYMAFFFSFFVIAIFHIIRLVGGPGIFSFGIFTEQIANLIGKWNDLAIFFGAAGLLSFLSIELVNLSKAFRYMLYGVLATSFVFLAIVNFSIIWAILGVFSLVFLVYYISFKNTPHQKAALGFDMKEHSENGGSIPVNRKIPILPLVVLILSISFFFYGNQIMSRLSEKLNISVVDVRPSWATTYTVAVNTVKSYPLFGVGENLFSNSWLQFKPVEINYTPYWNTDFTYGVGFVWTTVVTTGILGLLSWLIFIGLFFYIGFRAILNPIPDLIGRYLVTSSFLVALYLWIVSLFYNPSNVILFLTFFFTGLTLAALIEQRLIKVKTLSYSQDPKMNFFTVLVLIVLMIGGVSLGYLYIERYVAAYNFQKALLAFNRDGDVDTAEQYLTKATDLDQNDLYYRAMTEIDLIKMDAILKKDPKTITQDDARKQFEGALGTALRHAKQAKDIDVNNYLNWTSLGRVYESVVPLNIDGAYTSAKDSYTKAIALNAKNPSIPLTLARLEIAKKDTVKAREYIMQALQLKNNYTEAVFLLAQIEVSDGNIKAAVQAVEAATVMSPDDSTIFYQLGFLRFYDKNYAGAAQALEKALQLNNVYANAKYFLGLSYERLGRIQDAMTQFKDIKASNPSNAEIDQIISRLKEGKPLFAPENKALMDAAAKKTTK
jgi:tetratricopeptide (TPR) repeat protein